MDKIFPFLWVKGESHECIEKEMRAIKQLGIDAVCVESRTHPDFCGETWFVDMRFILQTAKNLDMRVWLLDDAHYPTGWANGNIEKHPEDRAWHLKAEFKDVCGELNGAKVYLPQAEEDIVYHIFLVKRTANKLDLSEVLDVTKNYANGYVKLPDVVGSYKLIRLSKSREGYERPCYVDMCNPNSVDRLIEAVYEPHYQHFKGEFGKTFVGFFSDEPRFANAAMEGFGITNAYQCTLGIEGMCYPWSDEVDEILALPKEELLSLWWDCGEKTSEIRCNYMAAITDCYGKYFSGRLANWCHEHGVMYAGHIIEDMNAHTHMGCSAGHYFKSQEGADFASIDVVLHQIKAFETQNCTRAPICDGYADPQFFIYTLAKLASSCARIDKEKQGRALCEIFGAYGHGESVRTMLFLLNHMLSRGINVFIPHAFSMENNDTDCPPYFNMNGKNPALPGYGVLFGYMKKMTELLSGGKADIKTAILYHAEAEWSGKPCMHTDVVAKYLTENQIDFDILPVDKLKDAVVKGDSVCVGNVKYKTILVPYAEYLPEYAKKLLATVEKYTLWVDEKVSNIDKFIVQAKTYSLHHSERDLRIMAYEKENNKFLFLFNEGYAPIQNSLSIKQGVYEIENPLTEEKFYYQGTQLPIDMQSGETWIIREKEGVCEKSVHEKQIQPTWEISARAWNEQAFAYVTTSSKESDIHDLASFENFSGEIKYKTSISLTAGERLCLTYRGEYCRVCVDGHTSVSIDGKAVSKEIKKDGIYEVEVSIGSSLGYSEHDTFSQYDYLEPTYIQQVKVIKN